MYACGGAGITRFKAQPEKYTAIFFQADMASWPQEQQKYTLLHREGTKGFKPSAVSEHGGFKCIVAQFQKLPPLTLGAATDRYTDSFSYQGQACLSAKPGRGEGVGDVAGLKLWGEIDPSDIKQANNYPAPRFSPTLPYPYPYPYPSPYPYLYPYL